MARVLPLRHRRNRRQQVRWRTPFSELLEPRIVLAAGQWIAVINSMAPADNLEEQARLAQDLLAASDVEQQEARVVAALDLSGSMLVQAPDYSTAESVSATLGQVPGFVFVTEYVAPGSPLEMEYTGRIVAPQRERSEAIFGPFDYTTFLEREANGEFPDHSGPVDGTELDALGNNNIGNSGTAFFTQSETTLLAYGNNVILGFNDSGSNAGGSNKFTGFARSTDSGANFTDGGTLPTNNAGDAGDPVLARNDATGRLYFSTLQFAGSGINMFRSDDNGVTWTGPVQAAPGKSGFQDKQWHVVDNFAGSGNGNVYMVARDFGTGNGIYFFRSVDNGNTFGPNGGTLIVSGLQGAYVAVGADHSVMVFWWAGSTLQMRKSIDQGLTFGAPVIVASGLVGGSNGDLGLVGQNNGEAFNRTIRSNSFPHAVVNPVSGHIYVTYNSDGAGIDKADVFMTMSSNGGTTWSTPVKVNDDVTTNDQWQPTLAVTPDGSKLGIFYNSRQEDTTTFDGDPVNNQFKYYGRIGNISGSSVTFAPSFAISDTPSKPEVGRDSAVNTTYMGDYNQAVATPGAFHVVWSDNRSILPLGGTRMDPNVYYERISVGLTVTTTNPAAGSIVTAPPTVFTVSVTEPLNPASVDAGDLTVNGIPASSVLYTPGTTTITFNYAVSPVTVQGNQTLVISAGAFNRASDGAGVAAYTATFVYDATPLTVTSTTPNFPNGVFTLPGPLTYDVTFNETLNPGSIQASDLSLSGIAGAFVSGVTVLPGNTTARFTIGGIAIEGALTASIGAGLVLDSFGGLNSVFSAVYQVDYGIFPYPAPLTPKNPPGSLIYDPTLTGLINFAGDTDRFTLNIDPGQTISLLVDPVGTPTPVLYGGVGNGAGTTAGQLLLINQTTAASTVISDPVTPGGLSGLVFDPSSGEFLGSTINAGVSSLVRINATTGALISTVGAITDGVGGPVLPIGDLAIQPGTNVLFAITSNSGGPVGGRLYTINKLTGVATFVGNAGSGSGGGISFAPDGSLYQTAHNSNGGFFSLNWLDPTNAARISTVPLSAYFDGLAIRPSDGVFFAAQGGTGSAIYTVNPTTGAITLVGNTTSTTSDLAFIPAQGIAPVVELRDPANVVLGSASAGPALTALLQTVDTTTGGTYKIAVSSSNSNTGGYTLQVVLNAAIEEEGQIAGSTNSTLGTAQNINGSFIDLGAANSQAERGAVLGITDPAVTGAIPDLYSFGMDAGETTTIAVTGLSAGTLSVELLNSVGTVLATGLSGATNLTRVISNFAISLSGTYYARVSGGTLISYSVVVTRNAALDTEPNDSILTAQSISGLAGVLGFIGGTSSNSVTLNAVDSGWYTNSGSHNPTNTNYFVGRFSPDTYRNFFVFNLAGITQPITGAQLSVFNPASGYSSGDATETYSLFDISTPVSSLVAGGTNLGIYNDLGTGTSQGGAIVSSATNNTLVPVSVNAAGVAALELARGGLAALGGALTTLSGLANEYMFAFSGAGPVQLNLNLGFSEDWYSVSVTDLNAPLVFQTSTPGDGPGEFVNTLNPAIELYTPGSLLAASGTVLPDGRNEMISHQPLVTGTYRVRVRSQSGSGEYFLGRNTAPTVSVSATSPVSEGSATLLTGAINDPDALDSHTVLINWGPGQASQTISLPAGVLNFQVPHTYADDDPSSTASDVYPVSVTVIDVHGASGTASTSVTVDNVAPQNVNSGADQTVNEGDLVSLFGSFTDPGVLDTHAQTWTVVASNGQSIPNGSGGSFSFVPADNGTYTVTYTVTDDDLGSTSDTVVVTVDNVAPQNVNAGADQTVSEGDLVSLFGSFTDPGVSDTHTQFWSVVASNGQLITGGSGGAYNFIPADNGTYTVTYTVTDDDLGTTSDTVIVTVNNVAPEIESIQFSLSIISEGENATVFGTFSDPALFSATETFSGTAVWSDAVTTVLTVDSYGNFVTSRFFADDDPTGTASDSFIVNITITDDDLGSDTESSGTLSVNNVAPVLGSASTTATIADLAVVGELVTATVSYSDVGTLDTHAVLINWADGSTSSGTAGGGTASGGHAYAAAGIYTVTMTVTDDDTGTSVATTTAYVSGISVVGGRLQIIGTNDDDHVSVNLAKNGSSQVIRVHASFIPGNPGFIDIPAAGVTSIYMPLFGGDDHAGFAGDMNIPTVIDGGSGSDHLNAGGGGAVMLGGIGNDFLLGGKANDILIGGTGADNLNGGAGEDILIGGTTSYDSSLDALFTLLAEWTSTRTQPVRVADLRTGAGPVLGGLKLVKSVTVFDDGARDSLTGAADLDWYFYLVGEDELNGIGGSEYRN